jgi:hypothetical protein
MQTLRQAVIEVVETRMDEDPMSPRIEAEQPFFFMRSQIVVFDTALRIDQPEALVDLTAQLTSGSLFYHFIDARRRSAIGKDDFSEWLTAKGPAYAPLVEALAVVDPYFNSLLELRDQLAAIFGAHLKKGER